MSELSQSQQDEAEEDFMLMCEKIPEDELRDFVNQLEREGMPLHIDKCQWLLRIGRRFRVSLPRALVRVIQVFPEVKKKLAL